MKYECWVCLCTVFLWLCDSTRGRYHDSGRYGYCSCLLPCAVATSIRRSMQLCTS